MQGDDLQYLNSHDWILWNPIAPVRLLSTFLLDPPEVLEMASRAWSGYRRSSTIILPRWVRMEELRQYSRELGEFPKMKGNLGQAIGTYYISF